MSNDKRGDLVVLVSLPLAVREALGDLALRISDERVSPWEGGSL